MGNRLAITLIALLVSVSCSNPAPADTTRVVVHTEGQGENTWSLVGWRQGHTGDLCMEMRQASGRAITGGCGFTLTPALHLYTAAGAGLVPGDSADRIVFGVLPADASVVSATLPAATGAPPKREPLLDFRASTSSSGRGPAKPTARNTRCWTLRDDRFDSEAALAIRLNGKWA